MSAVVFCLNCQRVMNVNEYLHPAHQCVRLNDGRVVEREPQPQLFDGDDAS